MKRLLTVIALLLTVACAGMQKDCAQTSAGSFGADWLVVQYDINMQPKMCWKLHNAVVESEDGGNVGWQDPDGHLAHISGWENRVQVKGGNFASAAAVLGIDDRLCGTGKYPKGQQ